MKSPVGTDLYGTSSLTGIELVIAATLVMASFAYLAIKLVHESKEPLMNK